MSSKRGGVFIIDDHALFSQSLVMSLAQEGLEVEWIHVIEEMEPGEILNLVGAFSPAVVLLDLHLGGRVGSGRRLIKPLKAGGAQVIVVTGETDAVELAGCVVEGAEGVVGKDISFVELVDLLCRAARGESILSLAKRARMLSSWREHQVIEKVKLAPFEDLTCRESEVLSALVGGKTAVAISTDLYISLTTVRSHIRSILLKLQVNSQLEAVALVRNTGWRTEAQVKLSPSDRAELHA